MKDLNFFEPYLHKEHQSEKRKPLYTALLAVGVLIVIAVPLGIYSWMHLEKQEMDRMNQELSTPAMQASLKRVENKQAKVNAMMAILPVLQQADTVLSGTDSVTDGLLQAVVDAIPPNVRFDELTLSGSGGTISGNAKNRPDIAELEYNLRAMNQFSQILLESVEMNTEGYAYTLTLTRKGGVTDETDQKGE